MKRTFTILMAFLLIGCAETNKNKFLEVYEEPMHKLVFEKDELKIIDVQINPRDTTQFHLHTQCFCFFRRAESC
jgi:uncharacterized protein YcfL